MPRSSDFFWKSFWIRSGRSPSFLDLADEAATFALLRFTGGLHSSSSPISSLLFPSSLQKCSSLYFLSHVAFTVVFSYPLVTAYVSFFSLRQPERSFSYIFFAYVVWVAAIELLHSLHLWRFAFFTAFADLLLVALWNQVPFSPFPELAHPVFAHGVLVVTRSSPSFTVEF